MIGEREITRRKKAGRATNLKCLDIQKRDQSKELGHQFLRTVEANISIEALHNTRKRCTKVTIQSTLFQIAVSTLPVNEQHSTRHYDQVLEDVHQNCRVRIPED